MINKKLPILNDEQSAPFLDKLTELSESYIPGWKFSHENPDPSSVLAMLFTNMIATTDKSYENVIKKHKIQYLNLFDGIKDEPLQSAKSHVVFTTITGAEGPVYVPKNTQITAGEDKYGQSVVFETTTDFTAVDSTVDSVFVTQRKTDKIVKLYDKSEGPLEQCNITAFDLSLDNLSEHRFKASYRYLFQDMDDIKLVVNVYSTTDKKRKALVDKLVSSKIDWYIENEEENIYFDKVSKIDDTKILLTILNHPIEKAEGQEYFTLVLEGKGALQNLEIAGFNVENEESGIIPDKVVCDDISENVNHFKPFGSPLEIYSECYIESKRAFSRRGARITLNYDLDISVVHQTYEVPEEELDLKVIMKKPPKDKKIREVDIRADFVIWEYLSDTGYKRLLPDEQGGAIFTGEPRKQSVSFICPDDMVFSDDAEGKGRVRVRLLRADNLYRMPAYQYVPVINNLLISYDYKEHPQNPDKSEITNNFETVDITDDINAKRLTSLFYTKEHDKTSMYIGFDNNITGTPISIYFNISNCADIPVDFCVECLCENGYTPLKVIDSTNGMLNSGTIMMIIPPDVIKKDLYGKELYWIRFVSGTKAEKPYNLPVIKGIYMNAVSVVNSESHEDLFYVTDPDQRQEFKLSFVNLVNADVYVNELTNDYQEENWVLWRKAEFDGETGRVYSIDFVEGKLSFAPYAFSSIDTDRSEETVKVVYKTYSGSEGNVEERAISSLSQSIKYISDVYNPFAAYGGIDGYTEKTAARSTATLLRTRKRAVTESDYFDIISGTSYGVKSIKCISGIDLSGQSDENALTIAVLMDEYNKGSHIFSSVKDDIRDKLLECSDIVPMGKNLILSEPHFIKLNVRVWLELDRMENSFDLQNKALQNIKDFINPLTGSFDGKGWEIGVLPSKEQLIAYLKVNQKNISVSKMVMTAEFKGKEYTIDNEVYQQIKNPFAMAVNGEHTVYVSVKSSK